VVSGDRLHWKREASRIWLQIATLATELSWQSGAHVVRRMSPGWSPGSLAVSCTSRRRMSKHVLSSGSTMVPINQSWSLTSRQGTEHLAADPGPTSHILPGSEASGSACSSSRRPRPWRDFWFIARMGGWAENQGQMNHTPSPQVSAAPSASMGVESVGDWIVDASPKYRGSCYLADLWYHKYSSV
jgi:hypothetical protein